MKWDEQNTVIKHCTSNCPRYDGRSRGSQHFQIQQIHRSAGGGRLPAVYCAFRLTPFNALPDRGGVKSNREGGEKKQKRKEESPVCARVCMEFNTYQNLATYHHIYILISYIKCTKHCPR